MHASIIMIRHSLVPRPGEHAPVPLLVSPFHTHKYTHTLYLTPRESALLVERFRAGQEMCANYV